MRKESILIEGLTFGGLYKDLLTGNVSAKTHLITMQNQGRGVREPGPHREHGA